MPATPPYAELHAHSAYSFLDGASLPEELAERAAQLGHGALAICDHDSLAGAMELSVASRGLPVRAIFGCELTVEAPGGREARRRAHLTLLAESRRGWRSLCRLVTLAHAGTREGPERRAGRPGVALEDVLGHAEGLVCLSGCAHHGVHDEAGLRALREAFGTERLRVELQRPFERHDRARNTALARLARRLELRTVATGNVHAHTPARACLQDALVAIRCGMTLDASEGERRANHSHVLASPQQMTGRFADHPEAAAESVALAERLTFDLRGDLGYRYPMAGRDEATRTLQGICGARLGERYGQGHRHREEAEARLERELSIIARLGLSGFFLLHHEILELAREVAAEVRGSGGAGGADSPRALLPPGRGRGSSVSSLVCYLTGLSHIDPIASELAIGRFLHEEIAGLPDIDIDFPRDVREVLIPRIMERYGTDRAALVAAFPTYRTRGAIRELGKALGLPSGELERLARGAEAWGSGAAAAEEVERALGKRSRGGRWAWLVRLCREAYGLPRHISQHPGGMVIATRPLIDCCPIVPAAMEGRQMVQWDKDSCADAGFLKIDLLSLGMLSAVERAVELVAEHEGERIDLSRIPFDDAETFAAIGAAETMGVFQIESRAQMGSLRRTRPQSLADLTIQVALVRPGPVVGGAVNPYIERRRRLMADPSYEPPHLHGSLRGCLSETLGTIIFQDQVLEVASAFAGYGAGEAESLRRAMSRKRSREAIERHRRRFTAGALARHPDVDEGLAERVWRMVAGFAGFGFPKAHGAAFGLLA
ncbi:MAG: DNA polymerase III subunit alpha, partial [Acidobacteriota bacterium]|nr:DNA polymerase III subunit alpha [Acidobacteriota bacterium]